MGKDYINIAGVKINNVNIDSACKIAHSFVKNRNKKSVPKIIQAINVDFIVKANTYEDVREITNKVDLAIPDGMPIVWVSKFMKNKLRQRVGGPDFFECFNAIANENRYRYYFMGATNDVVKKLINKLKSKYPNIEVVGYYCPPFTNMENSEENLLICKRVNELRPDVLWVGLGCPKQEKWIVKNKYNLKVPLVMGIGAVFQFYAGTLKRAPKWMQKCGFEWLYRFLKEPRRLWKRYLLEGPRFINYLIKYKKSDLINS